MDRATIYDNWLYTCLLYTSKRPKQILVVTQEQHDAIIHFADQRKDAELNTIYKLNECEFSIKPLYTYEK